MFGIDPSRRASMGYQLSHLSRGCRLGGAGKFLAFDSSGAGSRDILRLALRSRTFVSRPTVGWVQLHLFTEPTSREVRFRLALAEGKPLPDRLGVPDGQRWADLWSKWSDEDCAMSRLNERFDPTLRRALPEKVRTYQAEAARLLGVEIPSGNSTDDAEAGVTSAGETPTEKPQRPRSGRGRPPITVDPPINES